MVSVVFLRQTVAVVDSHRRLAGCRVDRQTDRGRVAVVTPSLAL